ncbi:protein of unknown function (DUF4139) domain containing protein [Amanita muscaria]
MATHDQPPASTSFISHVDLDSVSDSKIASVSVYTGRAEITRVFKLSVKTGQNLVKVNGLPNVLEHDSIRVEGRGPATIHDVTVSQMPEPQKPEMSPALLGLWRRKNLLDKALERATKTRNSLDKYLSSLHVEHVKADELEKIVEACDANGEKLEEKILDLKTQLQVAEKEIQKQEASENGKSASEKDNSLQLRTRLSLGLFAEKESEVELVLNYAVLNASWTPVYDVRVDMQASDTPITLVYKAAITQNTAEDWQDVPLTLETATPTFQVGIPKLCPWTLSVQRPIAVQHSIFAAAPSAPAVGALFGTSLSGPMPSNPISQTDSLRFRRADVSSKGNVSATFTVPGIITIPSDGTAHNVTVAELKLGATMSWVVVPKIDARARLSAKIKNASDYTLLRGVGSIYVDGSFISKSSVPNVSPGETFDCALGLDPAIRVTYHPVSKKTAQTGFYLKSNVNSYSQRISISNTKSITITDLRIVDQIPVSADESITVKLISPALPPVQSQVATSGPGKDEKKADQSALKPRVMVSKGITAEWGDGMEDSAATGDGTAAAGQDGKLSWLCETPSQGKASLLLQWEVTSPTSSYIPNL